MSVRSRDDVAGLRGWGGWVTDYAERTDPFDRSWKGVSVDTVGHESLVEPDAGLGEPSERRPSHNLARQSGWT